MQLRNLILTLTLLFEYGASQCGFVSIQGNNCQINERCETRENGSSHRCVCADGYVHRLNDSTCEKVSCHVNIRCGENEECGEDGECACVPGFSRTADSSSCQSVRNFSLSHIHSQRDVDLTFLSYLSEHLSR